MALSKSTCLTLILILLLAAIVLWPYPPTPRIVSNQWSAVRSMRILNTAEHNYSDQHPKVGFACNLNELGQQMQGSTDNYVDRLLAAGTKSGYNFAIRCDGESGQRSTTYTITA